MAGMDEVAAAEVAVSGESVEGAVEEAVSGESEVESGVKGIGVEGVDAAASVDAVLDAAFDDVVAGSGISVGSDWVAESVAAPLIAVEKPESQGQLSSCPPEGKSPLWP